MRFSERLQTLPPITQIAELQLLNAQGQLVGQIPHAPGKIGSLTVYHALYRQHGLLNADAARQGLEWFAEHTTEALAHPGSHPNIDRLLHIIASGETLSVVLIPKDNVDNSADDSADIPQHPPAKKP